MFIDYEKTLRIETDIANSVVQRTLKNNGVYVPQTIQAGLPVYFAVDNCDIKNDTADGKNEFHGTAQIVYQQSSESLKRENSTNVTPTLAAFNSFITNMLPVTIYCGLPLYPALPTDWSNFYTDLNLC